LPLSGTLALDATVEAWLQPEDLLWNARAVPGGRVGGRVAARVADRVDAWGGFDLKSAGWSPGFASLDPALYLAAGVDLHVGARTAAPIEE
jgi:hypothetical protein